MTKFRPSPQRKPAHAYHHGNLRQALVDQAVATIRDKGVEALTLRDAATRLRVSRTALYRHFADKQALLAAVATEGFRTFRQALADAWNGAGHTRAGFVAMGEAYIRFALANSAHYRVMFGGHVAREACDAELTAESDAAFRVLLDALVELQQAGRVRREDATELAVFVWASVHGAAMLGIGGQLSRPGVSMDHMIRATTARIWDAIARPAA